MVGKIYLIRHGESLQNYADVLSGVSDIPLSLRGQEQCKRLAEFFTNISIDKVYASPLTRSVQSAKLIFPSQADKIIIKNSLTEINYGIYEGYKRTGYSTSDDEIINQWLTKPSSVTFPEGDNLRKFTKRAKESFTFIASENKNKAIALVLHRTIIRILISQIIELPLDNFRLIPCSNCGVTEITFENRKWQLNSLNVTEKYLFSNEG